MWLWGEDYFLFKLFFWLVNRKEITIRKKRIGLTEIRMKWKILS